MPTNNSWNSQNPAQVAMGGTGIVTTTAYAPICAGTTATGAFQVADTGLASSGYILTSNGAGALPTWQAPLSSGNLVHIETKNLTNQTSIDFTTGITSTYTSYIFYISRIDSYTDAKDLQMLWSIDSGSTWLTTGYASGLNYSYYNSSLISNVNSSTYIYLTYNQSNLSYGVTGYLIVGNFGSLHYPTISGTLSYLQTGAPDISCSSIMARNGNVDVNAFRFIMSSGNISGLISLFGIN